MAAAAIPVATALAGDALAPAVGAGMAGLAGVAESAVPAWLSSGATGALLGGLGSYAMGQNPLQGMLMGGIGSGIGSQINLSGGAFDNGLLGNLFGGGVNPSTDDVAGALSSASPSQFANAPDVNIGSLNSSFDPGAASAAGGVNSQFSAGLAPSSGASSGGFWDSKLGKFLPYAGIGGAAMLADKMMAPKQVGPVGYKGPDDSRKVMPLDRTYQNVDPQDYFRAGGNRNFYNDVNPAMRYYATGGPVNGGSSYASSQNIPAAKKVPSRGIGTTAPTAYPIKGVKRGVVRLYDDGGMVNGPGDGMADQIPANLSDGEHVMTADEVSMLGNGSNAAGQKKMYQFRKNIRKHKTGSAKMMPKAKSPEAYAGLGGYMH